MDRSPDQSTVDEMPDPAQRRSGNRRDPKTRELAKVLRNSFAQEGCLPKTWSYLALTMACSIAIAILASGRIPSIVIIGLLFSAITLVWATPLIHGLAARSSFPRPLLMAGVVTVLPLFLFALGITHWTSNYDLTWDVAIPVLLCVGGIASAYLWRHPGMIFVCQLAVWVAVLLIHSTLTGVIALLIGVLLAGRVAQEQQRENAEEEENRLLRERMQTRFRDILADYEETGQGWFWETDRRGALTYISAPIARAIGSEPDALIGRPLVQLFDLNHDESESERTLLFHLSTRSAFQEVLVRSATEREERWWSLTGRPIFDQFDNFLGFRGSGTDLTEKRRSQKHASRLALYDSLTGLANRHHMNQLLEKILNARQEASRECSVLLLDLDRFKQVNDTLGHLAGDELLKQVAQRLSRTVNDSGTVGRLGGDEFKVIVPGSPSRGEIGQLAHEIIDSLAQPYMIDGQRVVIGASVGISLAPTDGTSTDELMRNADLALYAAKDSGRGRYHFYSNDLHAEAEARVKMEEDLRDALQEGALQLFYQPTVSLATQQIVGFEALLRWHHPHRGWVSPQKFIETAEDTGQILQIGEWALRTACHQLKEWPEEISVAVNVSPLQFANPHFAGIVTNAIAQAGIAPSRLELEITESVFLNDSTRTDDMFAALKRIGVRLALDDFGTGYSSLGYLKKAPFDKIKIDQSFVRGATQEGSRNGPIIASITSLAESLGMDTTAEGVETHDELELVKIHGCSHVQGFLFDRPLDQAEATERLEKGLHAQAKGPQSSRPARSTVLRRVLLSHGDDIYDATIRNLSSEGALIEGLWNVPPGTRFKLHFSQGSSVDCIARWNRYERMGIEFMAPIELNSNGEINSTGDKPSVHAPESLPRNSQAA